MIKQKKCEYCGKMFSKPVYCSKKEWLTRKFCSQSCSNKANRGVHFNNKYSVGRPPWNKGKKLPQFSGKNNPTWKGGKVTLICKECGKEFTVGRWRLGQAKFCSILCKQKNSNHGLTDLNKRIRMSLVYRQWKKKILKRDNYTCQICGARNHKGLGKTIELNVDHIKPFSQIIKENKIKNIENIMVCDELWDLDNGRTLCHKCHVKTNTFGSKMKNYKLGKNLLASGVQA